ncbi:MAG: hypothetical protein NVS3B17_00380 [Vulcanimicrobiaceae bacterium]
MRHEFAFALHEDGREPVRDFRRRHRISPRRRDGENRRIGNRLDLNPREQLASRDVEAQTPCDFPCDRDLLDEFGVRLARLHAVARKQGVEDRQTLSAVPVRGTGIAARATDDELRLRGKELGLNQREDRHGRNEDGENREEKRASTDDCLP